MVKCFWKTYSVDTAEGSLTLLQAGVPPSALLGELLAHTTPAAGPGPLQCEPGKQVREPGEQLALLPAS